MPLLDGAAGYILRSGEPHSCIRNHNEPVCQSVRVPFEQPPENFDLICGALIFKPHENDTPMRAPLPINLLAEILIVRNQNPPLVVCFLDNFIIFCPASFIIHGKDFVPLTV
jgi:hypothetical protein